MISILSLSCDLRKANAESGVDSIISFGKNYWNNLACKYLSGSEKSIFNALPKSKKSQVLDSILKEKNGEGAKQLLINWGIDFEMASSIAINIDKELVELKNSQVRLLDKDSYEVSSTVDLMIKSNDENHRLLGQNAYFDVENGSGDYNVLYSDFSSYDSSLDAVISSDSDLNNNDNANKNYLSNQNYTYQEYTDKQAQEIKERVKKYKIFKENVYKLSQTLRQSTFYAEELNTKLSGIDNKESNFILKVEDIKDIIRLIARIKMTQYTELSKKILDKNFSSIANDEESKRYALLYKDTNSTYLEVRKILGTILSKISSIVGGFKANIVDIKDSEKIKKAKEHAQGVLDILKLIDSGENVEAILTKAKEVENISNNK
nr:MULTISPECIES: hypothetical protein [Borreliella]